MTLEDDTVFFFVHRAGRVMPPSVGDITGEICVLGLLSSGGVIQSLVVNSSPELRRNVGRG